MSDFVQIDLPQRRSGPAHLVRGQLFPLAATSEHDAELRLTGHDGTRGGRTEGRIVDALGRVGAVVDHAVSGGAETGHEMGLQFEAGVIRPDRDDCHPASVGRQPPDTASAERQSSHP